MKLPFSKTTPVIGAIMKMEERYILEWVAWHKLHGFDIIIADNCNGGPQTELLQKLERDGSISLIDFRHRTSQPQMPAYCRIYWRSLALGYRYIGFLDADEFFEPLEAPPWSGASVVRSHLKRYLAVRYRWALFGSDGALTYDSELVVKRFEKRGLPDHQTNRTAKSFFRTYAVLYSAIRNPTRFLTQPHSPPISSKRTMLDGKSARDVSAKWVGGRIRHYAVKSREELLSKLEKRGDAFSVSARDAGEYAADVDLNDEFDPLTDSTISDLRRKILDFAVPRNTEN